MMAATASAQMFVSPGGGNIGRGETIRVENRGAQTGLVVICVDGKIYSHTEVGPNGEVTLRVPESPQLVGVEFELKTVEANGTIKSYTFRIT